MMRNLAISFLAVAVAAVAFFAGRASVPNPQLTNLTTVPPSIPSASTSQPERPETSVHRDPHAELLRALGLPTEERRRATRWAMNAWLAEEGAAALRTVRADPRLAEVVGLMTQIALVVYPDVFIEEPSLLEGAIEADSLSDPSAATVAALGRELAQEAVLGLRFRGAAGAGAGSFAGEARPLASEDAHGEIESILNERSPVMRMQRTAMLVYQMAERDPAAAAELVDSLPASIRRHAINALIGAWAKSDPSAAAQWLRNQGDLAAQQGFAQLAQQWGMVEFHSASAYGATLSGTQRQAFLDGLANVAHQVPKAETLAWIAGLEGDPSYSHLASIVAQGIAQEDASTALSLIESLPPSERLNGYASLLPTMAMQDPKAAMAASEVISDPFQRAPLVAMIANIWAQMEPELAMDWMLDLEPGPTRDQALESIAYDLAHFDPQRALEAIDEIADPELRRGPVVALFGQMEDENEAIRLGGEHGFDRETVLEMRANSLEGITLFPPGVDPGGVVVGSGSPSSATFFAAPPMLILDDGPGGPHAIAMPSDEEP